MKWALLMFAPLVAVAQVRIDHVSVAGASLATLRERLSHVGIPSEYGGKHSNGLTEMSLVSFPDGSYLELIAPQTGAAIPATHQWAKMLASEGAPAAWAMRVKSIEAEVQRLRTAGVNVEVQPKTGRARPDGVALEWQTADLTGALFPFLIQDFTPRSDRAQPSGHPTTKDFDGVRYVVIAVQNLPDAIALYRKAFNVPPPIKQVDTVWGAQLALLGGVPVILAAPVTPDSPLREHLGKFGESPVAFILTARNTKKYQAASKSRWFGEDVSWFDAALGWRLGYQ